MILRTGLGWLRAGEKEYLQPGHRFINFGDIFSLILICGCFNLNFFLEVRYIILGIFINVLLQEVRTGNKMSGNGCG